MLPHQAFSDTIRSSGSSPTISTSMQLRPLKNTRSIRLESRDVALHRSSCWQQVEPAPKPATAYASVNPSAVM